MATQSITSNFGTYTANGYTVSNNPWNAGTLVNGIDYTSTITLNPATFPSGIDFSWSWPLAGVGTVHAYPEIKYTLPSAVLIGDLANLSTTYSFSISGNTQDFNVAWDLWLGNSTSSAEVMVWVHSPQYPMGSNQSWQLTDSTIVNAKVFVANVGWTYVAVQTPTDQLSGTISLSDVFKTLIWEGVLTGNEYISNVQVGAEVQAGTGSLQINNLSYSSTANASIVGTTGNDTFTLNASGGETVIGNGGTDTAVFAGSYSTYQIENTASETLITQGGNISTLDVLEGVRYIKFADGTYDTATSTFTAAASAALAVSVDTVAPAVSSVVASGSGITNGTGDLNAGHVVTLTVNLSEAVTVAGGTPTLALNDGGTAAYVGGSGSNALTFSYTVAAGQNTAALAVTAVNLNSATVMDAAGNAAVLTAAVTTLAGTLQIDTTAPTAPVISSDSPASGNAVTLTGTAEANSTVAVYEGTSVVGTVTATNAGTWSYTTGQLAAGSYTFTATATDAAGNVSTMSQPIDPTIGTVTYSANNTTLIPTVSNNTVVSANNTNLTPTVSNDTVILSGNNDTVNLTGSNDAIQLSGSNDHLMIIGSGNSVNVTGLNDSVSSTGADMVTFSGSGGNTVDATIGSGGTLNLADKLSGSGNDTLALSGNSATVNLSQLAHLSGFSGISLSGSNDMLTLTNANLIVTRLSGSGDTITLGTGIDTVDYTNVNQSTHSSYDTIIGFNSSQDKIDFSAIGGLNSNAQQVTVNFLTSAPNKIAGHTIDVVTSGSNAIIYANATGSSENINGHQVDMQINLVGVNALHASDFILHH